MNKKKIVGLHSVKMSLKGLGSGIFFLIKVRSLYLDVQAKTYFWLGTFFGSVLSILIFFSAGQLLTPADW